MKVQDVKESTTSTHLEEILRRLPIQPDQRLIELGCGRAETTRKLAERFPGLEIVATEVDQAQHVKNLASDNLPNVRFKIGGAENIDMPDASVNYVLMLKSLHHVPIPLLQQSLSEIRRVLIPGGLAYLAEPVYAGTFNDVLKIFNDEQVVRQAAFTAVKEAVESGSFELIDQVFFSEVRRFADFAEFEDQVIKVTHRSFEIDDQLHQTIRTAFARLTDSNGAVEFLTPQRVDLLKRPER